VPTAIAKQASSRVPIVFGAAADPVGRGLVVSLARPGGNVTGRTIRLPIARGIPLTGSVTLSELPGGKQHEIGDEADPAEQQHVRGQVDPGGDGLNVIPHRYLPHRLSRCIEFIVCRWKPNPRGTQWRIRSMTRL
jgi:hypothetical protein